MIKIEIAIFFSNQPLLYDIICQKKSNFPNQGKILTNSNNFIFISNYFEKIRLMAKKPFLEI